MHSFRNILEAKLSQDSKESTVPVDMKTVCFLATKYIEELYGLQGKTNILPLDFVDGVLTLGVYKSLWQSEVGLMKDGLQERLNKELGSEVVTEIRIKRK